MTGAAGVAIRQLPIAPKKVRQVCKSPLANLADSFRMRVALGNPA